MTEYGFDMEAFNAAKFKRRKEVVKVPQLAEFFKGGAPAEIECQNLTLDEAEKVVAEVQSHLKSKLSGVQNAAATGEHADLVNSFRDYIFSRKEDLSTSTVLKMYTICFGVVQFQGNHKAMLQIAKGAGIAEKLYRCIDRLTGLGPVNAGELKDSGETPESKTPSKSQPKETKEAE